jgi:hypothetical protein
VAKKLRKYVEDPQYNPENVAKQSRAAMSLCMWTHAMDVYNRVSKVRGGSMCVFVQQGVQDKGGKNVQMCVSGSSR